MEELAKLEAERGNPEYLEARGSLGEHGSLEARGSLGEHGSPMRPAGGAKTKKETDGGKRRLEDAGKSRRASNEMCTFLILNISSLQLIPVNMIAYRAQYGSANPTAIIVPAIAATLFSSFVAVVYCKLKDHGRDNRAYDGTKGRGGKAV